MAARTESSKHSSNARRPACNREVERCIRPPGSAVGLLAKGTFEGRERAQEISSAVPVLVQQDVHENESEHDHLITQPLQSLADETHDTPSASQCRSHTARCRPRGLRLTAPIEPAMM